MNCADCDSPLVCRYDDRHQCFTQWTTEPPTEPGWYWAGRSNPDDSAVFVIEIRLYPDGLFVFDGLETTPIADAPSVYGYTHLLRIEPPEVPT